MAGSLLKQTGRPATHFPTQPVSLDGREEPTWRFALAKGHSDWQVY